MIAVSRIAVLSAACVVALAGCGPEALVRTQVGIPTRLQGHYVRVAGTRPGLVASVFSYRDSFADAARDVPFDAPHLFVTKGHQTSDGYVADELALGKMVDRFILGPIWTELERCPGMARFADDAWTLALGSSEACKRWNGVYRAHAPTPAAVPQAAAAARLPRGEVSLVLPPSTTPFARMLSQLPTLHASERACPVALRAPPAETLGEEPGRAALEHSGEAVGEEFDVLRHDSGAALPDHTDSTRRYQALYVRTETREAVVDADDRTFDGARSAGRVFLLDVPAGAVVCMGDIEASNGSGILATTGRNAQMWLSIHLALAEERAIALGLHAIATP